jgi:hypothetical protein
MALQLTPWSPASSPPPVSSATAPTSWLSATDMPRPMSTPPGKVAVNLAPLNDFRPMAIVKHRSLKYFQDMDEQRQQRAQNMKHGVGRCTPGATRAAATRIRTEAQLHTLTQLFIDMSHLRQDMPPQVYAVLHAAAVKLNRPDGKINPSNRSGTPLYTDLHRSLLDMRMTGELTDAEMVAAQTPVGAATSPVGAVTFADAADESSGLFEPPPMMLPGPATRVYVAPQPVYQTLPDFPASPCNDKENQLGQNSNVTTTVTMQVQHAGYLPDPFGTNNGSEVPPAKRQQLISWDFDEEEF